MSCVCSSCNAGADAQILSIGARSGVEIAKKMRCPKTGREWFERQFVPTSEPPPAEKLYAECPGPQDLG